MTETFRGLPQKEDRMPANEHVPISLDEVTSEIATILARGYMRHRTLYARHGRDLMGCKSPVCKPCYCREDRNINTSRKQGRNREEPSGGAVGRRVVGIPNPNEYLLERILSRPNMSLAWRQVKANRGAPGVDNMPIDDFMAYAHEHWEEIRSSIFAGTYKPLPVKRVEIPKATGGTRPLEIPAVLDRLIQQAIAQELFPIFDPGFSEKSFGFHKGLLARDAVLQVRDYIRQGYRVSVDCDLAKFFDTVEHDVLMARVSAISASSN
jgi:retron-type reverse transcriptase